MTPNERERAVDRVLEWINPDAARDVTFTHFDNRSTFVAKVYEWDYEDRSHTEQEMADSPEITGSVEDGQVSFNPPS